MSRKYGPFFLREKAGDSPSTACYPSLYIFINLPSKSNTLFKPMISTTSDSSDLPSDLTKEQMGVKATISKSPNAPNFIF